MLRQSVFRLPRSGRAKLPVYHSFQQTACFSTSRFRPQTNPYSNTTRSFILNPLDTKFNNSSFKPLNFRAYSSSTSDEQKDIDKQGKETRTKKVVKRERSTVGKCLNATKKFCVAIIRCFTHPKQSWQGFKVGWHHFVETLKHYWKGAKLLKADIKTCSGLIRKLVSGQKLSWREQRQLKRTVLDVLRFIPFVFFVIIPFLEIALPLVLYFFPNMLPSTFSTRHQKEEKEKKLLSARLKSVQFVSGLHSEYLERIEDDEELTKVKAILKKFRRGSSLSPPELDLIVPFFRDHVTLDNMDSVQLQNLCQFLNLTSIGTDALLRTRLRNRIKWIRKEDRQIEKTGVANLTNSLLVELLQERGMRVDKNLFDLRKNLENWLQLTQHKEVPTSLLLISRSLMIKDAHVDETAALQATLASLPAAVEEVLVDQAHHEDPEVEKRVLEHHSKLISEEQQFEKSIEEKKTGYRDSEDTEDVKDLNRDLKESAKLKVASGIKAATDDSAVDLERDQLKLWKDRHQKKKEKVVEAEKYLVEWGNKLNTTFTRDDQLDEEEFMILWIDLMNFEKARGEEVFETYDTGKDGLIQVKRAKQAIDEEARKTEEAFDEPKIINYMKNELADDEEITPKKERENLKKTEDKLSKRIEQMFLKLEKEIEKSDAKIGKNLRIDKELSVQSLEDKLQEQFGSLSKEEHEALETFCQKKTSLNKISKDDIDLEVGEIFKDEEDEQEEEMDVEELETKTKP